MWDLNKSQKHELQHEVSFDLESVQVPDQVEPHEPFKVSVTPRNTGERAGYFKVTVGPSDAPHLVGIELFVEPGKANTGSRKFQYPSPHPSNDKAATEKNGQKHIPFTINKPVGKSIEPNIKIEGDNK